MIKARHNTFGFWLLAIGSSFFILLLISTFSQWFFKFTLIKISLDNKQEFAAQIFFMIAGLLVFVSILFDKVKRISINQIDQTIIIKSFIIPIKEKYSFGEIDGYVDTRAWHNNWTSYKCVCLIKNGTIILKIDGFFYSNIEEIQKGFQNIKYLGFRKSNIFNTTKIDS